MSSPGRKAWRGGPAPVERHWSRQPPEGDHEPMPSTLLAFLGACTLVAASPGPSTVLIIKESLRSRRAGFLT